MKETILFVIEDNKEIVTYITDMADEIGWVTKNARCVDCALQMAGEFADNNQCDIQLVLIDLMLPVTRVDLEKFDRLIKEREDTIMQYQDEGNGNELSINLLNQGHDTLKIIDEDIRKLIKMDGGILFLEQASEIMSGWKVAIFSARDQKKLFDRITQITGKTNLVEWFQKPVTPDRLMTLFQKIAKESQMGST